MSNILRVIYIFYDIVETISQTNLSHIAHGTETKVSRLRIAESDNRCRFWRNKIFSRFFSDRRLSIHRLIFEMGMEICFRTRKFVDKNCVTFLRYAKIHCSTNTQWYRICRVRGICSVRIARESRGARAYTTHSYGYAGAISV